jgi:hypothetical protein
MNDFKNFSKFVKKHLKQLSYLRAQKENKLLKIYRIFAKFIQIICSNSGSRLCVTNKKISNMRENTNSVVPVIFSFVNSLEKNEN